MPPVVPGADLSPVAPALKSSEPPLPAALEPAAYGVTGVEAERQPALLAALRERHIGADCAGQLEPRAVAVARELGVAAVTSQGAVN